MTSKTPPSPAEQLTLNVPDVSAENSSHDPEVLPGETFITNPTLIHIIKMELAIDILTGFDEEADLRTSMAKARSKAGRIGDLNVQKAAGEEARALEDELNVSMENTKALYAAMIGVKVTRDKKGKVVPVDKADDMELDEKYTGHRTEFAGRDPKIVGTGSQKRRVDPTEYREHMRKIYTETIQRRKQSFQTAAADFAGHTD